MRLILPALLFALLYGAVNPRPIRAQAEQIVTAEEVNLAIDDAIVYLRNKQLPDGSWPAPGLALQNYAGGVTALCTLSLLNAGVPKTDPMIERALANLRKLDSLQTYVVALQTMVLCYAEPEKDLLQIRRNVSYLETIQIRDTGTWTYGNPEARQVSQGDNSNVQFALLALHEAERIGVKTSDATWKLAYDHWINTQNGDGSWGYLDGHPGSGSMTCAGIASLIMASEKLDVGDAVVQNDEVICCGAQSDHDAVEKGLKWLGDRFSVESNPGDSRHTLYYLYGLERIGRISNRRFIGGVDWYRSGAKVLVREQARFLGAREHGYWIGNGSGETDPVIGTSLALLFLAKGRRPVLAAKLEFGPGGNWNHHRQDLAHLVTYCERKWKREMTWQVIESRRATANDLIQAPVLFLSGSENPDFSDAEAKAVRKYLDMGGFLFAEAACGPGRSTGFDEGFREFMERVFPERDDQGRLSNGLRLLPPGHSVWGVEEPVEPLSVELYGIDVGCRTNVIYSPEPLGAYWELDRIGKPEYGPKVENEIRVRRSIGINVLAYATNREVKYKLEIPTIAGDDGPKDVIERAKLYVAEVKHAGGSGVAPAALVNLMKQLAIDTGLRVSTEKRELALMQESLFDYHMVFMHGREAFTLSDAERKQLRTYIERGGLVFADSVCSSAAFTESFRREVTAIFPEIALQPIPADHPMYTSQFGGFDLSTVTLRDPRRADGAGPLRADVLRIAPELEGLRIGERFGVIFSKYDLSCALERQNSLECTGYARDDAAKIGVNVVLFSLRGNL